MQLTYLSRTTPSFSNLLHPAGWSPPNDTEYALFALPARLRALGMGIPARLRALGMGIPARLRALGMGIPSRNADSEFSASLKILMASLNKFYHRIRTAANEVTSKHLHSKALIHTQKKIGRTAQVRPMN